MKKRLVSMILSAVLFATSVPVAAFAEDMNLPAGMIMRSLMESRLLRLALRIIPAVLSSMQSGRNATTMWIFHRRSMRMGISLR